MSGPVGGRPSRLPPPSWKRLAGAICPRHLVSGWDGCCAEEMPGTQILTLPGLAAAGRASPLSCPKQQITLIFSVNTAQVLSKPNPRIMLSGERAAAPRRVLSHSAFCAWLLGPWGPWLLWLFASLRCLVGMEGAAWGCEEKRGNGWWRRPCRFQRRPESSEGPRPGLTGWRADGAMEGPPAVSFCCSLRGTRPQLGSLGALRDRAGLGTGGCPLGRRFCHRPGGGVKAATSRSHSRSGMYTLFCW